MGQRRTINELVDVVLAASSHSRADYPVTYAPLRPGDQRHMAADITKARNVLNWQPCMGFSDGMRNTIEWGLSAR